MNQKKKKHYIDQAREEKNNEIAHGQTMFWYQIQEGNGANNKSSACEIVQKGYLCIKLNEYVNIKISISNDCKWNLPGHNQTFHLVI